MFPTTASTQQIIILFAQALDFSSISRRTDNEQASAAYTFTTEQGGGNVLKMELDGRVYEAVMDEKNEPIQLSRYDEASKMYITLCFDNKSNGSTSDEILLRLKNCYLKNWT